VLERWGQLANWLHLPSLMPALIPDSRDLTAASRFMQANGAQADFQAIVDVGTTIGNYLRYPAMVLLAFMAFMLYRSNATLKFKTVFSMNRLKMAEIAIWPQITPIAKLDLVAQDLDKGPWAMSKTPLKFAKDNNLLREEKKDGKVVAVLLPGNAHRVFALQLGVLWTGFEKLPVHVQALFAIFAARANRDRDGANKLLEQIAESAINGHQLNFAGIRPLFVKNCNNNKVIGKILGQHAYVLTIMASLLELARTDGVLASAEFLWLKPLDRRLWYMLNTVGRRTAVPEIAGA
jgi:intracellular multiplication protein IcmP